MMLHHYVDTLKIEKHIGLKVYASVRSKIIIQRLFFLGVSISYDRILSICNNIGLNILKMYEQDGVFVSFNIKLGIFTITAKDNVDLKTRSKDQLK